MNIEVFISLLGEKLNAKNSQVRPVLIKYVNTLNSIPNLDFFQYLPKVLEQLF